MNRAALPILVCDTLTEELSILTFDTYIEVLSNNFYETKGHAIKLNNELFRRGTVTLPKGNKNENSRRITIYIEEKGPTRENWG